MAADPKLPQVDPRLPANLSPLPWSLPHALRWQGRNSRKVSWVGVHAAGEGKGSLPVHSIKPKDIPDSERRMADAAMISAAPRMYICLFDIIQQDLMQRVQGLSRTDPLRLLFDEAVGCLEQARGELGELKTPGQEKSVEDLV